MKKNSKVVNQELDLIRPFFKSKPFFISNLVRISSNQSQSRISRNSWLAIELRVVYRVEVSKGAVEPSSAFLLVKILTNSFITRFL